MTHRILNLMHSPSPVKHRGTIAHSLFCEIPGLATEGPPDAWRADTRQAEPVNADVWMAVWYTSHSVTGEHVPRGPVEAGLRALAPSAARMHAYYLKVVDEEIAALRREYDARIARLEAVVAEHSPAVTRGRDLLRDTIARLRAEIGADLENISEEEEAELWKLVDFSVADEEV